ncbi:DNA-3-methyladenine glycosylase I [Furfurilactobacillus sp. WILCCON 0119]
MHGQQRVCNCVYHDLEWGVPVEDDQALFECLSLELFQAGLNWQLILKRRPALKAALAAFDVDVLAAFTEVDQMMYLTTPTVIRNRRKLAAVIHNARVWQDQRLAGVSPATTLWRLQRQVGLDTPRLVTVVCTQFKEWGLQGLGQKATRSFLQASGFINDHDHQCFRRQEIFLSSHTTGRIS